MKPMLSYDQFKSFIELQLGPAKETESLPSDPKVITVSRQTGAGGTTVARLLAEFMSNQAIDSSDSWNVFDRELAERVLEDHNLPPRLARYMKEDRNQGIVNAIEELLGLHPSAWTMVEHTAETILKLAHMGSVVIVGRGANMITAGIKNAFHVRIVGSLEKRVQHMIELGLFSESEALQLVNKYDQQRRAYLRTYFDRSIDDPTLYHLIVNTDELGYEQAAEMIGRAALTFLRANDRFSFR